MPAVRVADREALRAEQPVKGLLERDGVELERDVARLDDPAAKLPSRRVRDLPPVDDAVR